ncbi:hypothetical protein Y032_0147g2583 [Ancylostoma ceylanicum]|uniref:Uncharacterized protein n=1 Tax=Ancylostoma ceylanicum TaxID=53326 RepID=A0A016T228_9BILA|nr:hypothetical protein Y032_0147g2583 [Ancylostoma ceylanicum]
MNVSGKVLGFPLILQSGQVFVPRCGIICYLYVYLFSTSGNNQSDKILPYLLGKLIGYRRVTFTLIGFRRRVAITLPQVFMNPATVQPVPLVTVWDSENSKSPNLNP